MKRKREIKCNINRQSRYISCTDIFGQNKTELHIEYIIYNNTMTTAHRATYKSAKATYNGIEQGNYYTGGVGTNAVAARDLPGQKTLKRRLEGQGTEEELGAKDFKKIALMRP